MTITNKSLTEIYEGSNGPAVVRVTYIFNTTTNTYRLALGGAIAISEHGIQNADLLAAQAAFAELLAMLVDKYPYTEPEG